MAVTAKRVAKVLDEVIDGILDLPVDWDEFLGTKLANKVKKVMFEAGVWEKDEWDDE